MPTRPVAAESMWPMALGANRSGGLLGVSLEGGWQARKRDVLPFVGGTFRQKKRRTFAVRRAEASD